MQEITEHSLAEVEDEEETGNHGNKKKKKMQRNRLLQRPDESIFASHGFPQFENMTKDEFAKHIADSRVYNHGNLFMDLPSQFWLVLNFEKKESSASVTGSTCTLMSKFYVYNFILRRVYWQYYTVCCVNRAGICDRAFLNCLSGSDSRQPGVLSKSYVISVGVLFQLGHFHRAIDISKTVKSHRRTVWATFYLYFYR